MAKKDNEIEETKVEEKKKKDNETKETKVKEKKKKEKKNEEKVKKENFFVGVKKELSKVKWPTRKEVLKYTISTITFVVLLVLFFVLISLLMSGIKGAFN